MGGHTAGPWFPMVDTAKGAEPGRVHVGHYREDGTVCHLPKTPANALLVAAAPDLLEALEMVRDADDDCGRDGLARIPAPARKRIDAAIAKATGGGR